MKITNLEELKEATKKLNPKALEKRQQALMLMNKVSRYTPNYDSLFQCTYCHECSSFEGRCPVCGEEMYELDELILE